MSFPSSRQVTEILQAIGAGEENASDQLIPLVYGELRRLAQTFMANEKPGQTLQAAST